MHLIIGVTGHRNLDPQDARALESAVLDALMALDKQHPTDTKCLLTGLAEGADCVVALCALRLGWQTMAVLALPVEEFERDFSTQASLAQFRALLGRFDRMQQASTTPLPRPECYGAVGEFICESAHSLIALWDGDTAVVPKVGGTAWVVERFKQKRNAGGPGSLIHIPVRRA